MNMSKKILVVDDERSIRNTLKDILGFEGYTILEAEDGGKAIELIKGNDSFDCVICDIKMPKADGMEVLDACLESRPNTPIIMISGHGTISTAVEAVKKGAYDYIPKPPDLNKLLSTVKNAFENPVSSTAIQSATANTKLKVKSSKFEFELIAHSPAMQQLLAMVERVAHTDARVLILGPNGAGKELISRRIHQLSQRSGNPLITLNCAAIPSELIESELFGHEKGSFTNAIKQHIGKFEQADGGTLFLDEIGDMSLQAQAKVLRAMQEGVISRIGSNKDIKVNVRIIAATNKDLKEEIKNGLFREDLYHRLSVVELQVPPLNDRREDIEDLVHQLLDLLCKEYNRPLMEIDAAAIKMLQDKNWTGNVRQLRNVIERLIIFADKKITKNDVEMFALT